MPFETLTVKNIRARPVVLKLERPVIARIATITDWPLILIDLETEEGVVGHSYLEPYVTKTMAYLVPAIHDIGAMLKGRRVAPQELYELGRKSLHFVGYQGMSMIAVSGGRHGGVGCAGESGGPAALHAARRVGRSGQGL